MNLFTALISLYCKHLISCINALNLRKKFAINSRNISSVKKPKEEHISVKMANVDAYSAAESWIKQPERRSKPTAKTWLLHGICNMHAETEYTYNPPFRFWKDC